MKDIKLNREAVLALSQEDQMRLRILIIKVETIEAHLSRVK